MAQKKTLNLSKIKENKTLSDLPKAEKVNPIIKNLRPKNVVKDEDNKRHRIGRPQMGFIVGQKPKSIKDGTKVK